MNYIFTFLFFTLTFLMQGQNYSLSELEQLKDEELLAYFDIVDSDSIVGEQVARVYLDRARKKGDTIKMARGYDRLARIFHPEKNIMFADSLIYLTIDLSDITYPGLGYLIKGYHYDKLGDLPYATKNYLELNRVSIKNKNIVHQLYSLHSLIALKLAWGNKKEALSLQHTRNNLLKNKNIIQLIKNTARNKVKGKANDFFKIQEMSSTLGYVDCYLKLEKFDSASLYLRQGLKLIEEYDSSRSKSFYGSFIEASIEIDYYSGNYNNVINAINNAYDNADKIDLENYDFEFNFFNGLSLIEIGEFDLGVKSLKKADSIFEYQDIAIYPHQRVLFEKLLHVSRLRDENEKQIEYLNKLIYVDSIFKLNYHFFEPTITKNFETPWLIREKEVLIKDLEAQNKISQDIMYVVCVLLVFLLFFLVHLIYLKFRDKKRFLLLLAESTNRGGHLKKTLEKPEIGDEIIDELLKKLDQFERDEKFLSQSISLQKLAVTFKTNTKYLSNIINHEKEKSFPHYINDLRVDFALKEITENLKFRKYTIKAIAGDCGFNSAESFSKAFKKKHKVAASYFIKELEKLEKGP